MFAFLAALLFAVAWPWGQVDDRLHTPEYSEWAFDEFAAACADSDARVVGLLDDGWLDASLDAGVDPLADVDDLLDSLEQSLERFEAL